MPEHYDRMYGEFTSWSADAISEDDSYVVGLSKIAGIFSFNCQISIVSNLDFQGVVEFNANLITRNAVFWPSREVAGFDSLEPTASRPALDSDRYVVHLVDFGIVAIRTKVQIDHSRQVKSEHGRRSAVDASLAIIERRLPTGRL